MQSDDRQVDTFQGTVLTLHEGKATVRLNAPPNKGGCGACAHGHSCGIGRLAAVSTANVKQERSVQLSLDAPPDIGVGDRVGLIAPRASLPLLALLGYVFPAFAMLIGAALGQRLNGGDGLVALFSLMAFVLALALVRFATIRCASRYPGLCSLSLVPLSNTEFPHEY
jgi:sigma-E factor negative regulatory protein RseC